MNFTLNTIAQSLSDYLGPVFPGVTFYEDPNQQGSDAPCMFLQQRYSNLRQVYDNRWMRTIGLDLTYLEDYNRPDLQRRYQQAAEWLDLVMELFPYTDEMSGTTLLRTYERDWRIDLDARHYKFERRVFVELPVEAVKMREMEYNQTIKEVSDGK